MNLLKISDASLAILREIISVWPRISARLTGELPIIGTGAVTISQKSGITTVHVPTKPKDPEKIRRHGWIGRWAYFKDVQDTFPHTRNVYTADLYDTLGGTTIRVSNIQVLNSWEFENTAAIKAGYPIVTITPGCGDIIGIEDLPIEQWYQVVDVSIEDGEFYAVISQRNDPTFQES